MITSNNTDEEISGMRKYLDSHSGDDDVMIIGHGIVARGELEGCAKLLVNGHYEGNFDGEKICIGEHGKYAGDVTVDNASISGQYEGKLTVRGVLEVGRKAVIEGILVCKNIQKQDGSTIIAEIEEI